MYGSDLSNSPVNGYSSGTLACKTYNTSRMDCSRRNLKDIPVLDRNLTTVLDLSHNRLKEIRGEPFRNLSNLTHLDLSRNVISKLKSTVFRGRYSLLKLDMFGNELSDLSSDVFSGLLNLISLDIGGNPFLSITSSQTLATLSSLQYLSMAYYDSTLDDTLSGFDRLTKLTSLTIWFNTNITNTTFLPLAGLPIHELTLAPIHKENAIDTTMFVPFTSATDITTDFNVLSALRYLLSKLQTLRLTNPSARKFPNILHNSTFQVLSKFNKSLTHLILFLPSLRQIRNDSFIWLPNLVRLYVGGQVETIDKQSFRGLTTLQIMRLENNQLTTFPFDAVHNIGKSSSLQYLDLSSNSISTIPDDAFVAVSSLTYLYLENNRMQPLIQISTKWLNVLHNLKHLVFGSASGRYPYVTVELSTPLRSLQVLAIKTVDTVEFTTELCSSFPKVNYVVITDASILNFPYSMALHECLLLKSLDLSGSISDIDLTHLNINLNVPSLKDLTLARNELTSLEQVLFIKAPYLTLLNLTDNKIQIIASVISHAFKRLIYLSIDGNGVVSLAGVEGLVYLKHLNAARNQITDIPPWLTSTTNGPILMTLDLSANPFVKLSILESGSHQI